MPGGTARHDRVRSGGRSEKVRRAVARTVLDWLAEGLVDFAVGEAEACAGVNRKTVCRRWPTYTDLIRAGHRITGAGSAAPDLAAVIVERFEPVQAQRRAVVVRDVARGDMGAACSPAAVVNLPVSQLVVVPLLLRPRPTRKPRTTPTWCCA